MQKYFTEETNRNDVLLKSDGQRLKERACILGSFMKKVKSKELYSNGPVLRFKTESHCIILLDSLNLTALKQR